MSDIANNTGNDQKKKEDDLAEDTNRTSESENEEKDEKSSVTKSPKKEKEKPNKPAKKVQKKSEMKSEDETNESEEDEEDDDDQEEEEEEEKKLGLLDLPLEVSGSRERKKVERLEIRYPVPAKEKKTDIPEGSGEKLGDCPLIELQIQKIKADDLKPLHRLLFNRPGSSVEIKKNIRKFNGFPFDKQSPDYEKKKNVLDKMTAAGIKRICEILALERKGSKEERIGKIMTFLLSPKSFGEELAKGRKSSSKADKRKSKTDKSKSKTNSTQKKSKTKTTTTNEKNSETEDEMESAEENEKEEEDGSDADEKPKKKKVARKETKKPAKQKNNKGEAKTAKSNKKQSSDEDSSDDEPLMKKAKQPPTDEELKQLIKSILDGANLEEITMKTVCKQVYGTYPDFDLSDRKEFIKTTVRSIIS